MSVRKLKKICGNCCTSVPNMLANRSEVNEVPFFSLSLNSFN